jgi:hypothetical protein
VEEATRGGTQDGSSSTSDGDVWRLSLTSLQRLGMAATASGGGEAWDESGGWGEASNAVASGGGEGGEVPDPVPAASFARLFRCRHYR